MREVSLVLAVLGSLLFVLGLEIYRRWVIASKRTQHAMGQVLDKQVDTALYGDAPHAVVLTIRYMVTPDRAYDLQVRQTRDSGASIGDVVDVFYDPEHPEQAAVGVPAPNSNYYALSLLLGGLGCLLLGLLLLLAYA